MPRKLELRTYLQDRFNQQASGRLADEGFPKEEGILEDFTFQQNPWGRIWLPPMQIVVKAIDIFYTTAMRYNPFNQNLQKSTTTEARLSYIKSDQEREIDAFLTQSPKGKILRVTVSDYIESLI